MIGTNSGNIRQVRLFALRYLLLLLLFSGFYSCKHSSDVNEVRFGICTDIHKDIMHDADSRLLTFVNEMNRQKVNFTIQLGDFCRPYAYNDTFLGIWNSFEGPHYHVLGNHDMDGGFTEQQTMVYLGMKSSYYSFDQNRFHFIILDGNEKKDPPQEGYPRYIGERQKNWLIDDLRKTESQVILFSHQSLEDNWGVENQEDIRKILEDENKKAGKRKVLACFNGHSHLDAAEKINDIWYVEVNSMSYFWVGEEAKHLSYKEEVHKNYPWIEYTCPYEEPLYEIVTVSGDGTIEIKGTSTQWVGPSPAEAGYINDFYIDRINSAISDRILK
jgi:predicted phosphodiesterase